MSHLIQYLSAVLIALVVFIQQTSATASKSDIKLIVNLHNKLRAKHHSPPLKWDTKLAAYAQKQSNHCKFQHRGGPYGENLALAYPSWSSAINGWYNEVKDYHYNKPGFSLKTGHFTQVVWKNSHSVGCAKKSCPNLGSGAKLYTCSYAPAGNIVGDNNAYFKKNVLKP